MIEDIFFMMFKLIQNNYLKHRSWMKVEVNNFLSFF